MNQVPAMGFFLKHDTIPFLLERWSKMPEKYCISTIWQGDQSCEMREKSTVKKDAFRFCFLLFLPCFKSVFSVKHQVRTNRALQVSSRLEEGPQRVPQPELNPSQMGNTAVERAVWQTFKYLLNKLLYAHALIVSVQRAS